MNNASKSIYAKEALNQIPRILGNLDRNPYSPTYGCFHRDYWLEKTSDFPDAVRQFGVQSLALVYRHDFPGSRYKGEPKIKDWCIAGMRYWASIQHRDGSFDEFYPYERGWVGPTAFTAFAMIEAFSLLKDEMDDRSINIVRSAVRKAATFIARGESEEDHLANHHAMACLAVSKAYFLLGDSDLKEGYEACFANFLKYRHAEGWSQEYDGIDPGYLSATVSFFGKIYQDFPDSRILEIVSKSIEMCSFFAYPNGFYAGSTGSRNTLHFYPHGFEIFGPKFPLGWAVADKMLVGLGDGKLVPPDIMSDRYVAYRVSEYLQSYLDYQKRSSNLPSLPYEQKNQTWKIPGAGIWARKEAPIFVLANLAKGGVIKVFNSETGDLIANDAGIIGKSHKNQLVTSQWIDPKFKCTMKDNEFSVTGSMHHVPSTKLFTPLTSIAFRTIMITLGWCPSLAHWIKGRIRKTLMLGQRPVPMTFTRSLYLKENSILIKTQVVMQKKFKIQRLSIGGEFFVRYVPQSRYFQSQELHISARELTDNELLVLNENRTLTVEESLTL